MNTVSRLDTYLTALLVPHPSSSSTFSNTRASSSKSTSSSAQSTSSSSLASSGLHEAPESKPQRRPSTPRRGRSRRRRKPTTSSIKLPPPSTPFFLRIVLGLWSILLSFWMSLVGEIRAERVQRRKRRRVRSALAAAGVIGGIKIAGDDEAESKREGVSSDEGSGTELDGEGEGDGDGEGDADETPLKGGEDDGWVNPVTRAPAGMGDEIDEPTEEEFAEGADTPSAGILSTARHLQRTYSPSLSMSNANPALNTLKAGQGAEPGVASKSEPDAVTFRLRSAERRHRDSLPSTPASPSDNDGAGSFASSGDITPHKASSSIIAAAPSLQINPPTPPKLIGAFQPSSILTNPSHPASLPSSLASSSPSSSSSARPPSPPRTRSKRLLANPISTALLDPSKPAPTSSRSSASPSPIPRVRPHTTPFHLQKTLILDLDETLIHSTSRPIAGGGAGSGMLGVNLGALLGGRKKRREGHTVEVVIGGRSTTYHVYKRPYVDLFLKKVC